MKMPPSRSAGSHHHDLDIAIGYVTTAADAHGISCDNLRAGFVNGGAAHGQGLGWMLENSSHKTSLCMNRSCLTCYMHKWLCVFCS